MTKLFKKDGYSANRETKMNYDYLSDSEKLDLLRLLYHDLKNKDATGRSTRRDIEQKELIVQETQRVYNRIKRRAS